MKFSIGDKIILKRTGEEGHVVSYISAQMLEVEVNGTVFPVYADEVDHPYLKWFTEKKQPKPKSIPEQVPVEKAKYRPPKLAKGIYLSFLPVFRSNEMEDIVDQLKIYLLNELPYPVDFSYEVISQRGSEFSHSGKLHAFGNIYLHSIAFEDMNDQPKFHWQLSDAERTEMKTEEGMLRIRPAKLFEHISELLQKNEPSFSYLLVEDFLPKPAKQPQEKFEPVIKPKAIEASSFLRYAEQPRYELDLHIEKLVKNRRGLTSAEILKIQLDALQKNLQLAIANRQERMMIIHGLGKGTLREEVHKILKKIPEVERFANEWQGLYGFGATEVFFKY